MHTQPPVWLEIVGWVSLALAGISALWIVADIYLGGRRQSMRVMEVVYPVTALYWGPVALWFYRRHGRARARQGADSPRWAVLARAVSHCGAGCTLGDIIAEWLVVALGLTIAGTALFADFAMDFAWAWALGIVFQYFSIVPMRDDLGPLAGLWAAIKADTLSIVAFQIGLFAGMAIYQTLIWSHPLPKDTASYWFLMQLSMVLGFFTALPVNAWLVRSGVKESM